MRGRVDNGTADKQSRLLENGTEPLRQLAAPIYSEQLEVTMPVALKPAPAFDKATDSTTPWIHILWLGAAGLFVSILVLTYGLDLSPGLF